ncbi:MAG: thermonuclease family protein [Elusimicrobiota bacterium]
MKAAALLLAAILPVLAHAHRGGLDSHGCHHNRKAGGYHCHRGPLKGQDFASKAEMRKALAAEGDSDDYYGRLADGCKKRESVSCCMDSVRGMKKGGFELAPEDGCPDGSAGNMLRCIDSYKWCEPREAPKATQEPTWESFAGEVVRVHDGDIIEVMRKGKAVRVRLHGIDCPEKDQPFGTAAKKSMSELVFGKTVLVVVYDTDHYGRLVGEVFKDHRSVNAALVEAGLAWWYRRYAPDDKELGRLEAEARKEKRGLWAEEKALPPWEFRSKGR